MFNLGMYRSARILSTVRGLFTAYKEQILAVYKDQYNPCVRRFLK